jgi:uncharacterized protein YfeS
MHTGFTKVKIEGKRYWISADASKILPVISGGSDEGGDDDDKGDKEGDDKPTITQKQLNEILSGRVGKAKEKAISDLVNSLGLENPDQLKSLVQAAKDNEEKSKTDLEKAQSEANTHKSKAETLSRDFDQYKLTTEIQFALIDEGLTASEARITAKLVEVDELDGEKIKAAIGELKKVMPQIFTGKEKPNVQGGNPGTPPPGTGNGDGSNPQTVARSILHERHPQTKRS